MGAPRYGRSVTATGVVAMALVFVAALQGGEAQSCQSSVSVSPWDTGNKFPDVIVCCGGSVNFQWSGNQSVYQLTVGTCPDTFVNNATKNQKELLPATQGSGGVKALTFSIPGTNYLTSSQPGACASGLLFKVTVPTCGAAGGPSAFASGTPGGTSTSTSENSAASASGPPGTSRTITTPGFAASMSGGR